MDDLKGFAYLIIINLIVLNFKIIYEIIKKAFVKKKEITNTCPLQGGYYNQIKQLEDCVNMIKLENATINATVVNELKNILRQLEKGEDNFKQIHQSVNKLEISIAEIKSSNGG